MSININAAAKAVIANTNLKTGLPLVSYISFGLAHPVTGNLVSYVNNSGIEVPAAGTGGVVTQLTSSTTGVTINTESGQITTVALSLAAATNTTFTVTNSLVAANDVPVVSTTYAGNGTIQVFTKKVAAGAFDITIANIHASVALNALAVINFKVLKTSIT